MGRFSRFHIVVFAVAGVVASTGSAHATCAIPNAGYQGGAYGAYAVTTGGCFSDDLDANGGAESQCFGVLFNHGQRRPILTLLDG
jgi:hypothetical protein